MNLNNFFNPRSVAVIGASPDENKVGHSLVFNIAKDGQRKVFPVNPVHKEILGLQCFPSILAIGEPIDLAIIAVPAAVVPKVLKECAARNVRDAIIISSGFKEAGPEGKALEDRVKLIGKGSKMSILGPNCLGIIDAVSGLNASFAAKNPRIGGISILSQSGALGSVILDWSMEYGAGLSKFISLGNEADLTEIEFLEFLANDKNAKAVMAYLEKISDGPKFIELAKKITAKKPFVILKAGRTREGVRAAVSHTGSLAPDDAVFEAACRQSGIIIAESIKDFFNLIKLFQMNVFEPLTNIAVLTNGGGPSVVATDEIGLSKALTLAEFSKKTVNDLRAALPRMAAIQNPVDLIGDAPASRYESALKILTAEKNLDGVITILTPQMMTEVAATAEILASYSKQKPAFPVFMGGETLEPALKVFMKNGLVNFEYPEDVIHALDLLATSKERGIRKQEQGARGGEAAKTATPKMLDFNEASTLLKRYRINLDGVLVRERRDLDKVVQKYRNQHLAMKIVSRDIIHKTESGGIKLGISGAGEAERAWDDIMKSVHAKFRKAKIEGVLVQPMAHGKEVIIGMKRDNVFGPVILFGLGGIFTEAIKDVSMRVAPLAKKDALAMMQEIKGREILNGLRGEKAVNFEALANILVSVSKLSLEHRHIKEIDLNPVIASESSTRVVDARILTGA